MIRDQDNSHSPAPLVQGQLSAENDGPRRRVPFELRETSCAGQYLITTEDAEMLQEILDIHMEKPGVSSNGRFLFRDLKFTRQLSTFDRQNPTFSSSQFHGFFVLFWLGVVLLLVKVAANNWRIYGTLWGKNEILCLMFHKDVLVLGVTDLVLCWSPTLCLVLQWAVFKGYLRWSRTGWIVQNIWQATYLGVAIWWTYHRDWPWTHTVFIVLHSLTILMKQHSYASYNGYLSELFKKRELLQSRLHRLEGQSPDSSASQDQASTIQETDLQNIADLEQEEHRRLSKPPNLDQELVSLAKTMETGTPLDSLQVQSLTRLLRYEIDLLSDVLKGKCSLTKNYYPRNLTLKDFCDFNTMPTLVYELEYPRTERIDWLYVAEKTAATFGIIVVMIAVSQSWIYPVVMYTVRMKEAGMTVQQRMQEFPWVLSDLLFPFMMEYLLTFYLIWECVLNAVAEITRFADRGFYAAWWNSTSFDQFARDWNRPVHSFLLRHVYHSSISTFQLSRLSASLVTFFLSACVHELIMLCLFRRLRGYLLILQMCQLPLVALSRTRLLRGQRLLGNVIFWLGIFTGPSLLCSLYLII
ncbi:uncharacterized protein PFLUO_LOCUS9186 [Penicillium psychrofluorescens]|uniref:uncharacterized protein n=1 Tax=Penicillium psychrofluorescens TaxID=3158075 RepID=UPI003CCE3AAD